MTDVSEYHAEIQSLRAELRQLRGQLDSDGRHLRAVENGDARPKRLTLSEIVEQLLAAQSRHGGDRSSVRLTRNSKGDTQIEVVVGSGDGAGVDTAEACSAEAVRIYDALRMLYPQGQEPVSGGGQA